PLAPMIRLVLPDSITTLTFCKTVFSPKLLLISFTSIIKNPSSLKNRTFFWEYIIFLRELRKILNESWLKDSNYLISPENKWYAGSESTYFESIRPTRIVAAG